MDSDAASVMSPMSPVGSSSVRGDSSKVFEISIGNSEAALGHRKTVEDIVRVAWKARSDETASPGQIFKVTLLARGKGLRVWMDNVRMEEITSKIMLVFQRHFEKVTGGNVTMKVMFVEDVAALRQLDDVYKNKMQNLETGMVSQGLTIADNVSTMLMKRKNHESKNNSAQGQSSCGHVRNNQYHCCTPYPCGR